MYLGMYQLRMVGWRNGIPLFYQDTSHGILDENLNAPCKETWMGDVVTLHI